LSAAAQLKLARLLSGFGMAVAALRSYRRFLTRYPQAAEFAVTALQAGRLAAQEKLQDEAEWFLERAIAAGTLSAEARHEAEEVLGTLHAEVEAIPMAIVVEQPESTPVIARSSPAVAEETRDVPIVLEAAPIPPLLPTDNGQQSPHVFDTGLSTPPDHSSLTTHHTPSPPRRSLGEILAAFMEERNILWGEILGGLLIVGCSIALVISLWSQVEKIPYFPFVIFGTITAALYSGGLYTLHHWKLESTSRGLLVIATLLVPLNFLVMAGLPQTNLAIELAVTGVFLTLFVWLMGSAGRVLLPDHRWMMVVGILGTSACPLLVGLLTDAAQPMRGELFALLSGLPALCSFFSIGWVLQRSSRTETLDAPRSRCLLLFIGMATFALAVVLGFIAYRSHDLIDALHRLTVLVSLAGIPVFAGGMLVQRRLGSEEVVLRTTGTAVALGGMFLMVVAIALAWPQPLAIILVCVLNFAVLTGAAFRWQLPAAHAVALPCLALGYLTAYHGVIGNLHDAPTALQLVQMLFSSQSGTALAGVVVILGLAAAFIAPIGLKQHAAYYAIGSGVAAVISLITVTWQGSSEPLRAAFVYALYGVGALVLNGHWRRPSVGYAGEIALCIAVIYGVTAWLAGQPFSDPPSLQAYGIGLAGLTVLWPVLRLALQLTRSPSQTYALDSWLIDRGLLAALVLGQFALAIWSIAPALLHELTPLRYSVPDLASNIQAFGPAAWILLALLTVSLVISLWRQPLETVQGLVLLAVTVPLLVAGPLAVEHATSPALRWGLGFCFLGCSLLVWLRKPVAGLATQLRMPVDSANDIALPVRQMLIGLCVLPILLLTASHFAMRLGGLMPTPAEGTFFYDMRSFGRHGVPLILVAVALVGHALRERSAGYAFAAGLVVNAIVMGGYALSVITAGRNFDSADAVYLVQLGSISAALWALVWLATRQWLATWREDSLQVSRRLLMSAQIGLVIFGNAVLWLGGAGSIAAEFPARFPDLTQVYYGPAFWAREVGSPLGWLTLALAVTTIVYRARQQPLEAPSWKTGWVSMAVAMLLACGIERYASSGWGYRSLMLGSAAAALAAVLLSVWRSSRSIATPQAAIGSALSGAVFAALAAVLLGLKAAIFHQDHLWAAAAILLASTASAAVAVCRRQEPWALLSGLGLNLTASMIVWHYHVLRGIGFADWWFLLIQANAAATGAAALLWLAARKRFYGDLELKLSSSPLLFVQILMGILANGPLLGLALLILFVAPDPGTTLLNFLADVGKAGGWLALLLPMAAALWYTSQSTPRSRLPMAVVFGLALGILGACTACEWDASLAAIPGPSNWLGFHVLTAAWSTLGLGTLALGLVSVAVQTVQPTDANEPSVEPPAPWILRLIAFPTVQIQRWVEVIGWLIVLLALRGAGSTAGGVFWSPAAALTVVVMTVGMALWARKPRFVYLSGLLINLVGNLLLLVHGSPTFEDFFAINILCLALGSAFWSALEFALRTNALAFNVRCRTVAFTQLAAFLSLAGLMTLIGFAVISDVSAAGLLLPAALTWSALAVTALAFGIALWDADSRHGSVGLYVIGLLAVVLLLHEQHLSPLNFSCAAGLALAGYVLFATVIEQAFTRWHLDRRMRLPDAPARANPSWFLPLQALVSAAAVALSLWMAVGLPTVGLRLVGPLALCILFTAGVSLATRSTDPLHLDVRYATLSLLVLLLTDLGWALLPAEIGAPWLHRNIVLMTAAALMAGLYSRARNWLPAEWGEAIQRLRPLLLGVASVLLLVILGQEVAHYDLALKRAPVEPWAIGLIAIGFVAMIVAGLRYALFPERDPLQLPEQRRTLYVYGAEVLLALLFAHIKLTIPFAVGPYWTFILMGVAFAGVGLSELFKRRGVPVLAEPLQRTGIFLPVFPLLALWLRPAAEGLLPVAHQIVPGAEPFLLSFTKIPQQWGLYAWLWVLAALLYSLVALSRQSFRFAVVAALAGNFALWSLWQHTGMSFLVHPQLWLIPLGLILLAAEHLNRDKLVYAQSLTLRYTGLGLLYLSSAADMFIAGLGNSLWLPLILMLLSIAGGLLGILLRIRAYLFMGIGFLFLVIFSMIWHAAVDLSHTWVWWASGIILGVAILTLFAIFEKRRNDVLLVVEQIKQWR
jgi:hypothetical protein